MLRQIKAFRTVAFLVVAGALFGQNVPALFDRPGGFVPDEETAIKIAEAILFPIYGEQTIREQKPYVVKLVEGKWIIDGSLPKAKDPEDAIVGGTFHIVISQRDAKVLEIGHEA
jgi:NTF2 fold immunity protein